MKELINYITVVAPSLVAILGTAVTVVVAISKLKGAINEFKGDENLADLKRDVAEQRKENRRLSNRIDYLLEKLTGVLGYSEQKEKENEKDEK